MIVTDHPCDEGAAHLLGRGQVLQFFLYTWRWSITHLQLAVEQASNGRSRFVQGPPADEPRWTIVRPEGAC